MTEPTSKGTRPEHKLPGSSPKLEQALGDSSPDLHQAFVQIAGQVLEKTHCLCRAINAPNYRFFKDLGDREVQFCGITPMNGLDRIRVGVTNQEAGVTSTVVTLQRLTGEKAKWTEFDVDPHDPAQVVEAVRVIVRVSQAIR